MVTLEDVEEAASLTAERTYSGSLMVQARKRAVVAALRESGNVRLCTEAANVSRQVHYDWLKTDPEYARAAAEACAEFADNLEREAVRRAVEGWEEPVFGKLPGKDAGEGIIGYVRKFDSNLMRLALQGHKPGKYRDRTDRVDVNVHTRIEATLTREIVPADILELVQSGRIKGQALVALRQYMMRRQQQIVNGTFNDEEDAEARAQLLLPIRQIEAAQGNMPEPANK